MGDDVLMAKARVYMKKRQFETAIAQMAEIIEKFPDGILVDNALFQMAELYEEQLKNPAKAMELYEKILMDHMGSTYTVEARKRFRKLRGDMLN